MQVIIFQITTAGELCGLVNVQVFEEGNGSEGDIRLTFNFCGPGVYGSGHYLVVQTISHATMTTGPTLTMALVTILASDVWTLLQRTMTLMLTQENDGSCVYLLMRVLTFMNVEMYDLGGDGWNGATTTWKL